MIEQQWQSNGDCKITIAPHRSMSWGQNKLVIWSLGALCMGIAVAFTITTGTWVILPFAGIEVIALSTGLYYISWKQNLQHLINIRQDEIVIEKGVYRPQGISRWSKNDVAMVVGGTKHDWDAPSITLLYLQLNHVNNGKRAHKAKSTINELRLRNDRRISKRQMKILDDNLPKNLVEVGKFLHRDDSEQLVKSLSQFIPRYTLQT